MTTTIDTQQARLMRAFETLKNQHITPLLILSGSTGVIEEDLADYTGLALAAGTPGSWVGAHVGVREHRGAYWDESTDRYRYRHDDSPVRGMWFSYPRGREDIACVLRDALEDQAFHTHWLGTSAASVRLVLKEED
jgi:hypothetical protein